CRRNDCGDCKKVPFKNKSYDITEKLKELLELKGKNYNKKLQEICSLKMFKPIPGMKGVYWTGNEGDNDMDRLKLAAQKAVLFGNKVYIMPNPNKTPTLDFIFVRKGIYKGYDLKSVDGKNSVGDRLTESVRQTHRVLLNMCVDYDTRSLAKEIKKHFNNNKDVIEVLIYKGRTSTSVDRYKAESKKFIDSFVTEYKSQKR
ncbi:MAG: hypothetical protein Q4F84_08610, partial [Fibrobacter sp.]|nr:hypothetical protein [Fibrobacter sp.]